MKRNIKYNDMNRDLVLDFLLKEGDQWRSVRPEQARKFASIPREDASASKNVSVADISAIMG